jgi:hypothetical protein
MSEQAHQTFAQILSMIGRAARMLLGGLLQLISVITGALGRLLHS